MSTRGKRPAHQNRTAFAHNPNSRLTAKILAIPNDGLCQRCHAIIEWRKKYRKYKPLTQPKKCTQCAQKTVRFAYHTRCTPCSQAKKVCAKCGQQRDLIEKAVAPLSGEELMRWMADMGVRERRRRLVMREWERDEKTDDELRAMVNKYAAEAASRDGFDDDDDEFDDDDEDEEMEDGEEADEQKIEEAGIHNKTSGKLPTAAAPSSQLKAPLTANSSTSRPSSTSSPAAAATTSGRGVDKLSRGGTMGVNGVKSGSKTTAKQAMNDEDDFDDDDFD